MSEDATPLPAAPQTTTITLVEPISRGEKPAIEELVLRKPKGGELRGLSLQALVNADIDAIIRVLPRISTPFITEAEAANLSTEDLAEVGGTIVGFFMSPAQKALVAQMTGN